MKFFSILFTFSLMGSALAAQEATNEGTHGGLQFLFNKTNKTIVIEIGDFLPTPYRLGPGESAAAVVTTDRQAITIRSVE